MSTEAYLNDNNVGSIISEGLKARQNVSQEYIASAFTKDEAELERIHSSMTKRYAEEKRRADIGVTIYKGTTFVVGQVVGIVPIAGGLMQKFLDHTEKVLEENQRKIRIGIVERMIPDVEKHLNDPGLKKFRNTSLADRTKQLVGVSDKLFGKDFDDLDQEAKDKVQNLVIETLVNQVADLAKVTDTQGVEVRRLAKFAGEMEIIKANLEKSKSEVRRMGLGETTSETLKEATKTAESPERQEAAVEKSKRVTLQDAAKLAKGTSEQLGLATDIFRRIGNDDAAEVAAWLTGGANMLGSIALSVTNPWAILPTIQGGLAFFGVGGGGATPEQTIIDSQKIILETLQDIEKKIKQNHEETIMRLSRIEGNQYAILGGVADLLTGASRLCTNLVPQSRLDRDGLPFAEAGFWAQSLEEVLEHYLLHGQHSLDPCLTSMTKIWSGSLDGPQDTVLSLFQLLKDPGGHLSPEAFAQLRNMYNKTLEFTHEVYRLEALVLLVAPTRLLSDVDTKLEQAAQMAMKADQDSIYKPFGFPLNGKELDLDVRTSAVSLAALPEIRLLDHHFRIPLSPRAVEVPAVRLLSIFPYYELKDFLVKGLEPTAWAPKTLEGRDRLNEALNVVDIVIAQQVVLGGDILLPVLYAAITENWAALETEIVSADKDLSHIPILAYRARTATAWLIDGELSAPSKSKEKVDGIRSKAIDLLRTNRLLATNFMLYAVLWQLRATNSSFLSYSTALAYQGDPSLLRKVLPYGWDFRHSVEENPEKGIPKGWYVRIEDANFELPSAEAVSRNDLSLSPDLSRMLVIKDQILTAIAGFRMAGQPISDDVHQLRKLLLAGMNPL